ncbi:MAG: MBL fold metallo-hydrolase [Actinomycetes bacterium]
MAGPVVIRDLPEIGITVISRWVFNCYVVHDRGDGRPMVIDLGLPSQLPAVREVLREQGQDPDDLGAVVATHGHVDHVAGLTALTANDRAEILLPRTVEAMLAGTRPLRSPGPAAMSRILPVVAEQPRDWSALGELRPLMGHIGYDGRHIAFPEGADGWLDDDTPLPGAPDWRVVHAPGHTDDATCLFHEPTRTLISGDSVVSFAGRAWCNPEYVDAGESAATAARLRSLSVEHLLPGHGHIVTGRDVMGDAWDHDDHPPRSGRLRALWRIGRDHAAHHPGPS